MKYKDSYRAQKIYSTALSRSCKVVPEVLVTLMSWGPIDFLIFLVIVRLRSRRETEVVDLSCLLNCLRVSLLGFSSFCLTLSMILLTLSWGVHFVRRWYRPCPIQFVGVGGS